MLLLAFPDATAGGLWGRAGGSALGGARSAPGGRCEHTFSIKALPAGKYQLKLVNEEKNISTVIEVEIRAGQTTTKKLRL